MDSIGTSIAISGSGGVGKTTLCEKISKDLDCAMIPDVVDEVLHNHGFETWKDVEDPSKESLIRQEALQRKIELEQGQTRFVSDKSVVDYLAYWQLNTASKAPVSSSESFEHKVRQHLTTYDLIMLLPFGRFPIEDLRRRNPDSAHQLKVHSRITELLLKLRCPFVFWNPASYPTPASVLRLKLDSLNVGKNPANCAQVAIYPGTFDPITNAHLALANACLELVNEVWFCPNPDNPNSSREHLKLSRRLDMLKIACREHDNLSVYKREHDPYAMPNGRPRMQLLNEIKQRFGERQFWITIGSDKLTASEYGGQERVLSGTGHIIFERAGWPISPSQMSSFDYAIIKPSVSNGSSSEVKRRIKAGLSISELVPEPVTEYIEHYKLYK